MSGSFMRSHTFTMPNGRDPVRPRFHMATVQMEGASAEAGHPMFRDEERVEMIIPGNPLNRPVKVVDESHKRRWPEEYAAFKAGHTMSETGTPIEQWPMMTPAMVRMLKYMEVHTVEQVAKLDDQAVQRIGMGGRAMRNAAIQYLDEAEGQKLTTQLSRELELRDTQIASLTEQVRQLAAISEQQQRTLNARAEAASGPDTFIPGVPGMGVPVPPPVPESPFASFQEPKRRGRPPGSGRVNEEAAA